jgi:hypothetical protein
MATHNAGPFNVLALFSKSSHNIVYCEVDSSFMDYWCALFRQPLGSIIKRMYSLNDNEMRDSACTQVYESLRTLPQDYFSESKASILERTSKSRKDRKVANSGSHGPVFVKDTFKFIVTDKFQFFELGASKSIEIMHAEKVQNMSDLDSKLITIDEAMMLKMLGRVFQNHSNVLNDVLGKYVKKEKSEKKEKKSRSSEKSHSSEKHREEFKEGEHIPVGGGMVDPNLSDQYSQLGKQYTKLGDQYNQMSEQAKMSEQMPSEHKHHEEMIGESGQPRSRLGEQFSHLGTGHLGSGTGIGTTGIGSGIGTTGIGSGIGTTGIGSGVGSGVGTHFVPVMDPSTDPSLMPSSQLTDPSVPMSSRIVGEPVVTDPSMSVPSSKLSGDPSVTSRLADEPTTSQQHPFVI